MVIVFQHAFWQAFLPLIETKLAWISYLILSIFYLIRRWWSRWYRWVWGITSGSNEDRRRSRPHRRHRCLSRCRYACRLEDWRNSEMVREIKKTPLLRSRSAFTPISFVPLHRLMQHYLEGNDVRICFRTHGSYNVRFDINTKQCLNEYHNFTNKILKKSTKHLPK